MTQLIDRIRVRFRDNEQFRKLLDPVNRFLRKRETSRMNKAFLAHGLEAFSHLSDTLDRSGLRFWPEFGTLLGIYREGDFLKHDFDFDFGAYVEDADRIESCLLKAGFKRCHTYQCENDETIRETTFSFMDVHIDFFYFREADGRSECFNFIPDSTDAVSGKLLYRIKVFSFSPVVLKPVSFKGRDISVPADTADHLAVSYGSGFMVPDPNFKSINHNFLEDRHAVRL